MKNQSYVLSRYFNRFFNASLFFIASILTLTLFPLTTHPAEVVLAWNTVAEAVGYKVYYGSSSRTYQNPNDVGNQTSHTIQLDPGTYYFAVTAYNDYGESSFSEEASCTIQNEGPVTHVITASAGTNGTIAPSGTISIEEGAEQSFTIVPNANYHVANVLVDGTSVGPVTSYSFPAVAQDHTIAAIFSISTHTITASSGEHGSISPAGTLTLNHGSVQTFGIVPNANYHVANVLVDGTSVGAVNSYTFASITQDHMIAASFAINTYVITASSGGNGTISPSGAVSVAHGSNQTFTVSPAQNYHVSDLIVDGTSVGAQSSYTFSNVIGPHTISATFAADSHVIIASAGDNGMISPAGSVSVTHGGSRSFIITPDEHSHVADLVVDGQSVGAVTSYTFSNVTVNHAIFASFEGDNQVPVASAGPDQEVHEGVLVTLSGANSHDPDPDGVIISYLWEQSEGQTVTLSAPNAAITTFTAPDVSSDGAALVFRLTVTDNTGLKASDACIVNVSSVNIGPTANAGQDQDANEGDTVSLDASGSTDPDDGIISNLWEQIAGPNIVLSDPMAIQPMFTAPDVGPEGVSLTFQLTVEDKGGLKSTDTCIVNVLWVNVPPIANAGPDLTGVEGSSVTLDGSGSMDSDNAIVSYRWIQTGGNPVTLSDPAAVKPTFTIPHVEKDGDTFVFQLTVKDSGGLENADTCIVTAKAAAKRPPVPDIKANGQDGSLTVQFGSPVKITAALDPGDYAGQRVEFFISVQLPNKSWNSYLWSRYKWVRGITLSFGGNATKCYRDVLNTKKLAPGTYRFYFAVDEINNKKPDSTWKDSVEVYVKR